MSSGRSGVVRAVWASALVLCLLSAAQGPAEAGRRERRSRRAQSVGATASKEAAGSRAGRGRRVRPRGLHGRPARVMILTAPATITPGTSVDLTVWMTGIGRGGKHAALSLGVDPAILEYQGFEPTGRGSVMVQPYPDQPGVVSVYRSSLARGFAQAENVVTLHFTARAAGRSAIVLSDVRLLDRQAGDMDVVFEAGEIYVE